MKPEQLTPSTNAKLEELATEFRQQRAAYIGTLPLKYAAARNETFTEPDSLYQITSAQNPAAGDKDPLNLAISVHRADGGLLLFDNVEQTAPNEWQVTSGDARVTSERPQHTLQEDLAIALIDDLESTLSTRY